MLLIKLWKEKGKILEGILNYVFTKQDIEDIASERWEICKVCDKLDEKGNSCVVKATRPCCSLCGCSLKLKTRSMSSECDLGKWESHMSQNEEDLLNNQLGL